MNGISKELIARVTDALADVWGKDTEMHKWSIGNTSGACELTDGSIVTFDKPQIETQFCFGYGYCGMTSEEEMNDASNMARVAKTDEQYFINQNLKKIDGLIKELQDETKGIYTAPKYYGQSKENPLRYYLVLDTWDYLNRYSEMEQASEENRQIIVGMLLEECEKFLKRLKTYLKRYGLAKIHSWTYLSD